MLEDVWVKSLAWHALPAESEKRCRWGHGECNNPAAFELNRTIGGGKPRYWAYCTEHVKAYGNRVVGLEVQVRVPANSAAAKRGWTS
jgi:hypothetical protein